MTKKTVITTPLSRELIVRDHGHSFNLHVKDTDGTYAKPGEVYTSLNPEEATKLANALLGENATVVTDLPEAQLSGEWVEAGPHSRHINTSPAALRRVAKDLLAIAAKITELNTEKEAAEAKAAEEAKAKADAREKRRNELATELVGTPCTYSGRLAVLQDAIDRIIDLEEAAKV